MRTHYQGKWEAMFLRKDKGLVLAGEETGGIEVAVEKGVGSKTMKQTSFYVCGKEWL